MPATRIVFFNHKGGVSKTTSVFHVGWMLAELGHRTLLVDADPQCNLTGLILSEAGNFELFEEHYRKFPDQNLKAALRPVFEGALEPLRPAATMQIAGRDQLLLVPGHLELSEYDVTLTLAHELTGSIHALKNVPGAASKLLELTADACGADFVLVDVNPSLSSLNQNFFLSADGFVIPNSPDYFSQMAIRSLSRVLPRWAEWLDRAAAHPTLQTATYKVPSTKPKLLGTLIQNFRQRKDRPTGGYQAQIDAVFGAIDTHLAPALKASGLLLDEAKYKAVLGDETSGYCLGLIPDFNTLSARSHSGGTPVFALSDQQLGSAGVVLNQDQAKRVAFHEDYESMARKIVALAR